jgi:glyoxylase-like metal-dependent hydrolase (beta-lactamase superfamily II)
VRRFNFNIGRRSLHADGRQIVGQSQSRRYRQGEDHKVVFTHGHPDHLWGTVDELDELVTPGAAFYVAGAEWDFWNGDTAARGLAPERAGFVTGARRNYAAIKGKVNMVKPGNEIVPGLRIIDTPGHTQGHVSLELAGGDGLIVGGDALTHPLISFQHPGWKPPTDHLPDQAAATRCWIGWQMTAAD